MRVNRDFGIEVNPLGSENIDKYIKYINMKLASMGLPYFEGKDDEELKTAWDLIEHFREKDRLLSTHLSPADTRIQNFLDSYLNDLDDKTERLPSNTFVLDKHGLARVLSLPVDKDEFKTELVSSYRIKQGVVHNPKNDRRTTKGSFHVVEGGLPVPFDKKEVPKVAFSRILKSALNPGSEFKKLPFTSSQEKHAETFVSLLLRPIVCPEIPGYTEEKSMEIRFFAPGNIVCNLDFVESIFGNGGDPLLPENDAALNPKNWTGHTGCVILAPQITKLKKKDLGLPNIKDATERQIKDGMCWEKEDELYNDGTPYKITARDDRGVIVTIIGDNYFGYSKKEVKTQMGYSANLSGLYEEEHAGGALAYTCKNLGKSYKADSTIDTEHTFKKAMELLKDHVTIKPEGYAVDNRHPELIYVPEDTLFTLIDGQKATWKGGEIHILPGFYYVLPSGYKVRMEKHPQTPAWRLVGTDAEGTFCHKPCTVSGGGKSEISKSIWDAIDFGPIFTGDFEEDIVLVEEIINKDYSDRYRVPRKNNVSRKILSQDRSLGSVIRLLNENPDWSDDFNNWLQSVPSRIKSIVFLVKRFYEPSWGDNWKDKFSVDFINGKPGNQFKFNGRKISGSYLRIGRDTKGVGRTYKLRQDYLPADKLQLEDDITASVTVPARMLENLNPMYKNQSVKMAANSESRFFQRPDDAIIRGYDKQAEEDLSSTGMFISNFEPFPREYATELINDTINFNKYTDPVKDMLLEVQRDESIKYFVISSHPRIVNGAPTKNPRYLETQKDLINSLKSDVHKIGARLSREIPMDKPLHNPVNAILSGRRNNPIDRKEGIRPLAVYGPIHFQELPELLMDFMCSLTGKSPSTTGAGSEGALTKGPFNALVATTDLNNVMLSNILGEYNGYSSAAGNIGHKYKVAHDVSLLIPELWCRLTEDERNAYKLLENGHLERVEDFDYKGRTIPASILGMRLTKKFTQDFLGKIFDNPDSIFPEDMLKPELQDLEAFVDGIDNITETYKKISTEYIKDGSVEFAAPPLKALMYIMSQGEYQGMTLNSPQFRKMFTRDEVLNSKWYQDRLDAMQEKSIKLYESNVEYLNNFIGSSKPHEESVIDKAKVALKEAEELLSYYKSAKYREDLVGTIGADPLAR
ncbi:hypothetical protein EW093_15265 [Thiospirochaeta perfilievii]|uniref:PPi-type phosphoenolpyruvate carboxykinase lobe 2 domain-containing protein n=1 Tax=Thiospirochaeta perfilievii TaxID=252967 RepID=A0A5C1QFZ6_9SPIO|nr:hypothetical protein [Thiospirochaeta perfilievii]QEN05999.1 hypothetical protein EW093_15265 [Thiospirochaeta perfilievii]